MERPPYFPFRSDGCRAEYEQRCQERARLWPVPCETARIETPSGVTFVRACGRRGDPPLVLLPGVRASSLMWIAGVAPLAARYRVYALDVIGDAGFSVNRRDVSSYCD